MIQIIPSEKQQVIDRGKFIIRLFALGAEVPNQNDFGLYQLGRVDHATLEGGMVVPMHLHHNDEILSYMRSGTMLHKDSHDNEVVIHNQYLMMMNAGSGFHHEESVPTNSETAELLQIFMRPRTDELKPQVQFHPFEEPYSFNDWRLVAANEQSNAPLKINTDIKVMDTRLTAEKNISMPEINPNEMGYLYIFNGAASLQDKRQKLKKGDAVVFTKESFSIMANDDSDLVLFILDQQSPVSRNGLYAR